jgi:hypothetical protein
VIRVRHHRRDPGNRLARTFRKPLRRRFGRDKRIATPRWRSLAAWRRAERCLPAY